MVERRLDFLCWRRGFWRNVDAWTPLEGTICHIQDICVLCSISGVLTGAEGNSSILCCSLLVVRWVGAIEADRASGCTRVGSLEVSLQLNDGKVESDYGRPKGPKLIFLKIKCKLQNKCIVLTIKCITEKQNAFCYKTKYKSKKNRHF